MVFIPPYTQQGAEVRLRLDFLLLATDDNCRGYGYGAVVWRRLFAVVLRRYGQFLAAVLTTGSEDTTAILSCHSLTEAVFVHSSSVVRLKSSFHFIYLFLLLLFTLWSAKLLILFQLAKK